MCPNGLWRRVNPFNILSFLGPELPEVLIFKKVKNVKVITPQYMHNKLENKA